MSAKKEETEVPTKAGQHFFNDVLDRFVNPVVQQRIAEGSWQADTAISRFQVLLHEDGPIEVRLNEEVGGRLLVKPTKDGLEVGQEVHLHEIAEIAEYEPLEKDVGTPHITAFGHAGSWTVKFAFAGGHPTRHEFLARGQEFLETAGQALQGGRLGPFVDNGYSAAELLAKAELLSSRPTIELVLGSKSHGAIVQPYHAWAKLGNTDPRFAKTLSHLQRLRGPGRYADAELALSQGEANELLSVLKEMAEHVAEVAGREPGDGPMKYSVYATRDLKAGEVVDESASTIFPPKSS